MSEHPRIVARSLPEANQDIASLYERLGDELAVISIGEPGAPSAYGFRTDHPLHLRLEFHDVVEEVPSSTLAEYSMLHPPQPGDVERILAATDDLLDASLVYCHCNAGVSRSTATAFILRCAWTGPGTEYRALEAVFEDRPQAHPNELMVRYADELLERDGAMIEVLSDRLSEAQLRGDW